MILTTQLIVLLSKVSCVHYTIPTVEAISILENHVTYLVMVTALSAAPYYGRTRRLALDAFSGHILILCKCCTTSCLCTSLPVCRESSGVENPNHIHHTMGRDVFLQSPSAALNARRDTLQASRDAFASSSALCAPRTIPSCSNKSSEL